MSDWPHWHTASPWLTAKYSRLFSESGVSLFPRTPDPKYQRGGWVAVCRVCGGQWEEAWYDDGEDPFVALVYRSDVCKNVAELRHLVPLDVTETHFASDVERRALDLTP